MKKFMVSALLSLMSLPLMASTEEWFESQKPVVCGPFLEIIQIVTGKRFQEQPLWIGRSSTDPTYFSLFRNPATGTWTLVQYGKTIGCIVGQGRGEKTHEYDNNLGQQNQ